MQIRLKARMIAAEKDIQDFKGGPSWCFRFLGRKGLSVRTKTTICQQLPPDFEEKLTNFRNFTQEKIAENFIGPQDVINMDEVPLTFDLPLSRTVNKKGESSVTLKTTGHEKTLYLCSGLHSIGRKASTNGGLQKDYDAKGKFPKGHCRKSQQERVNGGNLNEGMVHRMLRQATRGFLSRE